MKDNIEADEETYLFPNFNLWPFQGICWKVTDHPDVASILNDDTGEERPIVNTIVHPPGKITFYFQRDEACFCEPEKVVYESKHHVRVKDILRFIHSYYTGPLTEAEEELYLHSIPLKKIFEHCKVRLSLTSTTGMLKRIDLFDDCVFLESFGEYKDGHFVGLQM